MAYINLEYLQTFGDIQLHANLNSFAIAQYIRKLGKDGMARIWFESSTSEMRDLLRWLRSTELPVFAAAANSLESRAEWPDDLDI